MSSTQAKRVDRKIQILRRTETDVFESNRRRDAVDDSMTRELCGHVVDVWRLSAGVLCRFVI